jgi:hypothetical protein
LFLSKDATCRGTTRVRARQPLLFDLDEPEGGETCTRVQDIPSLAEMGFPQRRMPDRTWLRSFMVPEQLPPETVPEIKHKPRRARS